MFARCGSLHFKFDLLAPHSLRANCNFVIFRIVRITRSCVLLSVARLNWRRKDGSTRSTDQRPARRDRTAPRPRADVHRAVDVRDPGAPQGEHDVAELPGDLDRAHGCARRVLSH